ncbi:MAG: hypothetical protein OI715_00195 (plasmid) [Candidatus Methanoperedens sp.]|nr:MAG: hypothetical protein OI715_00195 [Candidatus Methanoperedens sp.]
MRDEVYSSIGYGIGVLAALYAVGSPFLGPGFGYHWILGLTLIVSLWLFSCWPNYGQYVQFSINSISSFPVSIIIPKETEDTRAQSLFMAPIFATVLATFWLPVVYVFGLLVEYLNPIPLLAKYIPYVFIPVENYTQSMGSSIFLDIFSFRVNGIYAVMVVFYAGIFFGTYLYILLSQIAYFDRKLFWPLSNRFFPSFEWIPAVSTREALYAEMIWLVFSVMLLASIILTVFSIVVGDINGYVSRFATINFI